MTISSIKKKSNICFFYCRIARFVWKIVQVAFGLHSLENLSNFFGPWDQQLRTKLCPRICVEAIAICWSIWLT